MLMKCVWLPGALWNEEGGGRIAVLGSAQMFDDKWIDKEENSKLMDFIFRWLKPSSKLELDPRDTEDPNIGDLRHLPDIESLAERPKSCLQVSHTFLNQCSKLVISIAANKRH